jgi:hypothetical protein
MLRRPSANHHTLREEGCSSATFAWTQNWDPRVWNNLTRRGSLGSQFWVQAVAP